MRLPPASGGTEEDDDPTGVRAMLQAAPDPGPMPAEVMARIQATLVQEQTRRARHVPIAPDPPRAPGLGQVMPLVALPRRRRPRWRALSGAAAAILLLAVGLGVLAPNLLRSIGGNSGSTSAAGGAAVSRDSAAKGPLVVLRTSGTSFTTAGVAEHARRLSADSSSQEYEAPTPPGSSSWGSDQVLACLDALGVRVNPGITVLSDAGVYDGAPAAMLVVGQPDAPTRTAYLVRLTCSRGNTGLITSEVLAP